MHFKVIAYVYVNTRVVTSEEAFVKIRNLATANASINSSNNLTMSASSSPPQTPRERAVTFVKLTD